MAKYTVQFYTGDYIARQSRANTDKCICYVEQHFNSTTDPRAGYAMTVVGSNASEKSKQWGRDYAAAVAKEFNVPDNGILIGGYNGRGDGNIRHTTMPAILLEPLFCSNPKHAEIIRSSDGRMRLARILVETIRKHFPQGGKVAFSVGHKGRTAKPHDRGAVLVGGGMEADYAEDVLLLAQPMLESSSAETIPEAKCSCCGQPLPKKP